MKTQWEAAKEQFRACPPRYWIMLTVLVFFLGVNCGMLLMAIAHISCQ